MPASIGTAGGGRARGATVADWTLSIVVITYNEVDRIGGCLDSVFAACEPFAGVEVVVVDSRSTDGTVDVAREYPVTVLRLPAEPAVTPGAGRYVGTAATSGDLVLFVDGDMELTEGWLEGACWRVRSTPTLGGLDGHLNESTADTDGSTDVLRGVALYDRDALAAAGGFDPHLQAMEDIDVSYRLAAAGYDRLRLAAVVANHPVPDAARDRARRWANGYYHGRGDLFRKYLGRPRLFGRLAHRTRLYFAMLAWLVVGVGALVAAGAVGGVAWGAVSLVGLAGTSAVMGVEWTADKVASCGPVVAGTVLGFPGRHPAPAEYPLEAVETVTAGPAGVTAPSASVG